MRGRVLPAVRVGGMGGRLVAEDVGWLDKFAAAGMFPVGATPPPKSASVPYQAQRKPMGKTGKDGVLTRYGLSAVELAIPVRVVSEANQRDHWAVRKRRFDAQKMALAGVLAGISLPPLPVAVMWTKLGGRNLDTDNLAGSFKALRDHLADHYRVDDAAGSGIAWGYDQIPGGKHGVRVLIAVMPSMGPP